MPTSLQTARAIWQGLAVRTKYDLQERPLPPAAGVVMDELTKLGKRSPAMVLIAAMERHGVEDPAGVLLEAVCDAPFAFDCYRL